MQPRTQRTGVQLDDLIDRLGPGRRSDLGLRVLRFLASQGVRMGPDSFFDGDAVLHPALRWPAWQEWATEEAHPGGVGRWTQSEREVWNRLHDIGYSLLNESYGPVRHIQRLLEDTRVASGYAALHLIAGWIDEAFRNLWRTSEDGFEMLNAGQLVFHPLDTRYLAARWVRHVLLTADWFDGQADLLSRVQAVIHVAMGRAKVTWDEKRSREAAYGLVRGTAAEQSDFDNWLDEQRAQNDGYDPPVIEIRWPVINDPGPEALDRAASGPLRTDETYADLYAGEMFAPGAVAFLEVPGGEVSAVIAAYFARVLDNGGGEDAIQRELAVALRRVFRDPSILSITEVFLSR